MYDLIGEYEQSLSNTLEMKKRVEEKIFELKSIVANESIPFEERAAASDQLLLEEQDKSIISGMESDLVFAINWMLTSRRPGSVRGIDRRAAYEREKSFDPKLIENLFGASEESCWLETEDVSNNEEKAKVLEKALLVLTEREKEIYYLAKGYLLTHRSIAIKLNLTRPTVTQTIKRAERKIKKYIAKLEGAE
ncbi:sigma factor-like helix-turn-helix DNA-binding protein [Mesobacillus thioparans]|uniref:sigma factor-like helix-turn-helix DNA-binding protein n=1 Tax=Mesobacillus thioparans TaxID=370439 RepID=UPI0039EF8218